MPIDCPIPMLAAFASGDLIAAAGITLIIMGLMSFLRKRRKREAESPRITAHEQLERNRQLRGVRGDLESLMVEIEQFSKRLSTHLDAKAMAMELLLKRAEQRIAELERLLEAGQQAGQQGGPQGGTQSGPREPGDVPSSSHAGQQPGAQDSFAGGATSRSASEIPDDPLSRSVYQLADQGMDSGAIARKLEEHVGKIELILALRSA